MANTIRLKRASGSDPGASDLVTGELAVRTDTAKLFTKKDDNSVVEIGGATAGTDSVDSNAIQDDAVTADKLASDAVVTNSIVNDAVTFAKQQNISTSRVLGRVTSSTGNVEELTAANIRTLINVEDGATADQTKSDIDGLGIAASTAATLATSRTIAGVSFNGSANISLNNNAITNGAGYITATLTQEQVEDFVGGMVSGNTETGITVTYQDSDGTLDFVVASQTENDFTTTLKNKLDGIAASATNVTNNNQLTNGAGYITSADGGNAATLDSIDSSQFLRSDAADSSNSLLSFNGGVSISGRAASNVSTVSSASTITLDMTSATHFFVDLATNTTFASPSNQSSAIGQSGSIFIQQNGGSRTASFNSVFKFVGGTAPTLSTADNAVDRLDYIIKANNEIHAVISLDVK